MISVGVDTGSRCLGLAVLDTSPELRLPRVLLLGHVRRGDREPEAVADDATDELVAFLAPGSAGVVGIEEPPMMVGRDVRHGPQAAIGWRLGLVAGQIVGWCRGRGVRSQYVPVSDHRSWMLAFLARRGHLLARPDRGADPPAPPAPGRSRPLRDVTLDRRDGGLFLVWGCGHDHEITLGGLGCAPDACPRCAGRTARAAVETPEERAARVRDEWKALACRGVELVWPEAYADLVKGPRARARIETRDHRLTGVADAAEALWVAICAGCVE